MISLPLPKAKAKPTAQKQIAAIEKLTRIFAITVPAFLPREKPISRKAKPACMNITRMPATSTHTELIPTSIGSLPSLNRSSVSPSASAAPGATSSASSPAPKPAAQRVLRIDPPLSNSIDREDRPAAISRHCPRVEDSLWPCSPCGRARAVSTWTTSTAMSSRVSPPASAIALERQAAAVCAAVSPRAAASSCATSSGLSVCARRLGLGQAVRVEQQGVAGEQLDRGLGDPRVLDDAQQRALCTSSSRCAPAASIDHRRRMPAAGEREREAAARARRQAGEDRGQELAGRLSVSTARLSASSTAAGES